MNKLKNTMYPIMSEEEAWDICISMQDRDCPLPHLIEELDNYRQDFSYVFEKIRNEHSHISSKYYRTSNKEAIVNPLNLEHYARLMYYFSRRLFLEKVDKIILDQIFLSLRTRYCIDMFYEFDLKEYFIPHHALGTILGRAEYGTHMVVSQNCTIGRNKNRYPKFGNGVILRPGSMVLGGCNVGNNVHIAAGALIVDKDIPDNITVFGQVPNLVFKENTHDNKTLFFD